MKSLAVEALPGSLILEGARIAMLGYPREQAFALRRANNTVVVAVLPDGASDIALAEGFAVARPVAAVSTADVVVVGDCRKTWRYGEHHVQSGALVVFSSAHALHTGLCARGGFDAVLVVPDDYGCRIAVHRDVTRRAHARAVAFARAAIGGELRGTTISTEADLELATIGERAGSVLAYATSRAEEEEEAEVLDMTWRGPV